MIKRLYIASLFILCISCSDNSGNDSEYKVIQDHDPENTILNLPVTSHNYSDISFPPSFNDYVMTVLDNTPPDNLVTNAGATLGRVLFYDKNMSQNNTVSCASCHVQSQGFSDPGTFSEGFNGALTRRNSMGLANARFHESRKFFWDLRAESLEVQVLLPIQDDIEMGMTLEALTIKLATLPYYPDLFTDAFGTPEITSDRISKALAQFIRAMVSFQTKYDEGLMATGNMFADFPNFTAQENLGKSIFNGSFNPNIKGNCAECHMSNNGNPIISGNIIQNQAVFNMVFSPRNNGIDADENADDTGIGGVNGNTMATGAFKAPSLRNIELTAPYMHDGRLATLEDVVEHYSSGVLPHPQLSAELLNDDGTPVHLNLTQEQKDALVSFLKTLTDHNFINDEKFSDPFH